MGRTAIITGGAGGMGLETAALLGEKHPVLIADLDEHRLQQGVAQLTAKGVDAQWVVCDVTDKASVEAMFERAASMGEVGPVVHAAGLSPTMADPRTILRVNALGSVNVAEAALRGAGEGAATVLVASMAGHMTPRFLLPRRAYLHARTDPGRFLAATSRSVGRLPTVARRPTAYGISKNFVMWLAEQMAPEFGRKGARILSVSPGTFDTAMGRAEIVNGAATVTRQAALPRMGWPEEIAEVLAFCASERPGYLTGVDILVDGGTVAGYSLWKTLRESRGPGRK